MRAIKTSRGSILLHILVTSAVVALIAATLLRLAAMRFQVTARATRSAQERRYDDAALASIVSNWNSVSMACANNVPNYTCAPAAASVPGICGCTCTPSLPNFPTVYTSGTPSSCALSIVSTDLP